MYKIGIKSSFLCVLVLHERFSALLDRPPVNTSPIKTETVFKNRVLSRFIVEYFPSHTVSSHVHRVLLRLGQVYLIKSRARMYRQKNIFCMYIRYEAVRNSFRFFNNNNEKNRSYALVYTLIYAVYCLGNYNGRGQSTEKLFHSTLLQIFTNFSIRLIHIKFNRISQIDTFDRK